MNSGVMSDRRTTADRDSGDRRRALRYSLELPVEIGHAQGCVRDFSASGVFVETDRPFAPGSPITFSLVLGRLSSGIALTLSGEGRVIRTERRRGKHGMAVEITSWETTGEYCDVEPPRAA